MSEKQDENAATHLSVLLTGIDGRDKVHHFVHSPLGHTLGTRFGCGTGRRLVRTHGPAPQLGRLG